MSFQDFIAPAGRVAAGCLILALASPLAVAEDGLRIELVEVVPAPITENGMTVEEGKIAFTMRFGQFEFMWSEIPKVIGPEGFRVTLSIHGRLNDQSSDDRTVPMATSFFGTGFTTDPDLAQAEIIIGRGQDLSKSQDVIVKPDPGLKEGDLFEITVGASIGATTTYKYRVGPGSVPPTQDGELSATLSGCSDTIEISKMPKVACDILITSWQHNTSSPVVVSFPAEIDGFGNHKNGIQLEGRGNSDVYEWDSAPHRWGILVFACPSQSHVGANCYNSITAPGPTSTTILVQQGDQSVLLTLNLDARAGQSTGGKGAYLGCFKDPNNPFDLDGYLERSNENTPQRCIEQCAARGFPYAGVQYSESCLCGQSYGRFGPSDDCDMACTGDGTQVCGGINANSVYRALD